jgi:tetraacyldisaccharide 4'-kinase
MIMRPPEFWQKRGGAAALLAPLGALYGASVAAKAALARPYRARARVLCVGNLTAGGSGKTPVAIALGEMLLARGKKVFFLTRGYGGNDRGPVQVLASHSAAQMGDEALLLARTAPTIVARDRAVGAALADSRGAEIIVMDDGHQNFTLAKDLSLVVVDGETGFGNGRMIPAGPLREPVRQGLVRADAVVMMNDGAPDLQGFARPVLRARLTPQGDDLRGRRLFAFAGIGRPEKFVASLKQAGVDVAGTQFFPDHHPYSTEDIETLKRRGPLVTTEKDLVRLPPNQQQNITVLKVSAVFADDPGSLLDRLTS